MNQTQAIETWTRGLERPLTDREFAELQNALDDHPDWAAALAPDRAFDGMLRVLGQCDSCDSESFVASVMHEITSASSASAGLRPRCAAEPPSCRSTVVERRHVMTDNPRRSRRRVAVAVVATACVCLWVALARSPQPEAPLAEKETPSSPPPEANEPVGDLKERTEDPAPEQVARVQSPAPPSEELSELAPPEPTPTEVVPGEAQTTTPAEAPAATSPAAVPHRRFATIERAIGAVWESPPPPDLVDEPLKLLKGSIELVMFDGAIVRVEAPAEFWLLSSSGIRVEAGTIHAEVPPRKVAFLAETPTTLLSNFGAGFDVSVAGRHETTVRVDRGVVKLQPTLDPAADMQLDAGEFRHVARDGAVLDWRLDVKLDHLGSGSIMLNDHCCAVGRLIKAESDAKSALVGFNAARRQILRTIESFPNRRLSGRLTVNGIVMPVIAGSPTETRRMLVSGLERIERLFMRDRGAAPEPPRRRAGRRGPAAAGGFAFGPAVAIASGVPLGEFQLPMPIWEELMRWQRESPTNDPASLFAGPVLQRSGEPDLERELASRPEVDLFGDASNRREAWKRNIRAKQDAQGVSASLDVMAGGFQPFDGEPSPVIAPPRFEPLGEERTKRADLAGLPFKSYQEAPLTRQELAAMKAISRSHVTQLVKVFQGVEEQVQELAGASAEFSLIQALVAATPRLQSPEALPGLVQVFQADAAQGRVGLIHVLASVDGDAATKALAKRAIYDLSPVSRLSAIEALRMRSAEDVRPVLVAGLHYPWPPVAAHAAEAIAALDDQAAVPDLIGLLEAPDPRGPTHGNNGQTIVREMVRINHVRNCLLCHAPSVDANDYFRARVPEPNESPIRSMYSMSSPSDLFVRADGAYLRQDFSVVLDSKRHDFIVRERPLAKEAAESLARKLAEVPSPYAVSARHALRRLTGIDAGIDAAAWRRALAVAR